MAYELSTPKEVVDRILPMLRCPVSHQGLAWDGGQLVSEDGRRRYPQLDGIPDLRRPPERIHIDVPWYEPWEDLAQIRYEYPAPLACADLPRRFDAYQAGIVGSEGRGRWVLELGCADRHCEPFFVKHDFNYIGMDIERRGPGPHLLADAHNLPFKNSTLDICYAMALLEHLVSPLTVALEVFRILKEGGLVFGSAAFLFGFHDRASFYHMSHAGILCLLRTAGFTDVQVWPGWHYTRSIPQMAFGKYGAPWRAAARWVLSAEDWTFTRLVNAVRRAFGKAPRDLLHRSVCMAGGINFAARKP